MTKRRFVPGEPREWGEAYRQKGPARNERVGL